MPVGPKVDRDAKMYLNSRASQGKGEIKPGATYVVEHRDDAGSYGVSIWYLPKLNYDPSSKGWYWANFTANGKVVKTSADHENPFDKRGYYTTIRDGRLWVFQLGSTELSEFVESGSYEKHVTLPGEGPGGITVKGA